jgi:hypothetical protein
VQARLPTLQIPGLHLTDFQSKELRDSDVLVTYSKGQKPQRFLLRNDRLRAWVAPVVDLQPEATALELRTLGYHSQARWERRGQWIEIYAREGR